MKKNKISRVYTFAGILLVAFCILNLVIENLVYVNSRRIYDRNISSVEYLSGMNDCLSTIDDNVLMLVAGMQNNTGTDIFDNIEQGFQELFQWEGRYNALPGRSELEERRYQQASLSIAAYRKKINEVRNVLPVAGSEMARAIYAQELSPLQVCAAEMLDATIEIGTDQAEKNVRRSSILHGISQAVLILLALLGVVGMVIASRRALAANDEIERQSEELEEASVRLDRSRQKMEDAALMNILTGMQNRYALESRLERSIGKSRFNIAVFDVDNFKAINDTYGYETGDEYLACIAERLREQYGNTAEIFNVHGAEFCLLFSDSISDMQAQSLAEQIRQSIGTMIDAGGISLRSNVSGSLWHVLPNENLTVNDVLKKLDEALHAAKRDGGNRLYQIT
ncbi:MAG: GGDEF domain-containing protein [Oscillospiraceae bacterium]|nr:GGDEF domain-containing protein [Oscillospiraceae bacterium]